MSSSSYYNIDDILAEEELVPCQTLFDFSYLSHLDPDEGLGRTQASRDDKDSHRPTHYLQEGSKIKVPLWAVSKWAMLGYVRLSLPRHYARKARERIEADPSEVDLRKRNERFFTSGRKLVGLIELSSAKVSQAIAQQQPGSRSNHARRTSQLAALENVLKEAKALRRTLLSAYTGDRLRRTLDWSLSSVGEDVTSYTGKLTEMERRLFQCGAAAASNHARWSANGNRRSLVQPSTVTGTGKGTKSPLEQSNDSNDTEEQGRDKRTRVE